jgi:uncharacterized SAM-binding protein YcdF (DUF218 family)
VAGRHFSKFTFAILAAVAVLIALSHSVWMGWMGTCLVDAEKPVRADLIVVLAGDVYGHRILKGAELVKAGYAPSIVVSGPPGFYGLHENELAIPFALRHGYPEAWFIPFPHDALSTRDEARALLPEIEKLHARRVDVVTSDYHTRRALSMVRAAWPGVEIHMVAAPDEFFTPQGWWHTREGRKTFFLEWTKTLASLAGL